MLKEMMNREAHKNRDVVLCCIGSAYYILRLLLFLLDAEILLPMLMSALFLNIALFSNNVTASKKKVAFPYNADFCSPVSSCVISDFQVKTCERHQ